MTDTYLPARELVLWGRRPGEQEYNAILVTEVERVTNLDTVLEMIVAEGWEYKVKWMDLTAPDFSNASLLNI